MKVFYKVFIVLFLSRFVSAQAPYHYTLSEEDGLPTNEIYQVKQDKFGFIWIGCEAGLFRYDGIRYKQYNYAKENGRSISELRFDSKGQLWCQNFTGQIFRVIRDSLILFKDLSKELRVYPQFCVDKDGNVWIAAESYLEKFNSKAVSVLKIKPTTEELSWYDIEVDEQNRIFASSFQLGLCQIQCNNNTYRIVPANDRSTFGRIAIETVASGIYAIEEVVAGKQYTIYRLKDGKLTDFAKWNKNGFVYKMYEDADGDLWLCTSIGVFSVNNLNGGIIDASFILEKDKISGFFQDREKNIWLSSLQNGIHVIPNKQMFVFDNFNRSLTDRYISFLTTGKTNELMAGTYSGAIYKIIENNKAEQVFKHDGIYRAVKKIIPYKDGFFISRGAFSYDDKTKEVEIPALRNIRDFCVLNDTIYYTTSNTSGYFPLLNNLDRKNNSYRQTVTVIQKAGRSVACDTTNAKIFYASNDGVYEYFAKKLNPVIYNGERISASKLFYENKLLWIATINNGFIVYDGKSCFESKVNFLLKGKQIKTFKISNNVLWVATEQCLNKIDLVKITAEYYDLSDGLISREISEIVMVNGKVYLATNKGIVWFSEKAVSANLTQPLITLSDISINNQSIFLEKLNEFEYGNTKIEISFISPCFRARGKFGYKYRLVGLDTNWTSVSATNNKVIFAALPAGEFTFQVKAVNEDGVESSDKALFFFSIKKPFWQELWFYIIITVSGMLFALLVSFMVIKNIRKKARIMNDLNNSQLTAIRAQMNPHFMYNTLNSIQDLILKSDIKNTNYYLSKFSSLMRKILEFSESENILLHEEMEMLNDYLELEKLRFGDEFMYEINSSNELNAAKVFIPSLIIQPFVENAIKHGLLHKKGAKKLDLSFTNSNNKLRIVIQDNGVGRKRSAEIKNRSNIAHRSFASGAIKKRVELLNSNASSNITYTIVDLYENEIALGTKVVLEIELDTGR